MRDTKKPTRKMPSRSEIVAYWCSTNTFFDLQSDHINICWACGMPGVIERCHIRARSDGGTDDVSNLLLLCRRCHLDQEMICRTDVGQQNFMAALADGCPMFDVRFRGQMNNAILAGWITEDMQRTFNGHEGTTT